MKLTEKDYAMSRWYTPVNYNRARVQERMADLVLEEGGRVRTYPREYTIRCRYFFENIRALQEKIADNERAIRNCINPEKNVRLQAARRTAIENMQKKIAELEAMEAAAPVIKSRFLVKPAFELTSLRFVLDGAYYSFWFSDNVFAPDRYTKIRLEEDGRSYKAWSHSDDLTPEYAVKHYMYDPMFRPDASEDDIDRVAKELLEMLKGKPFGRIYANWHEAEETVKELDF